MPVADDGATARARQGQDQVGRPALPRAEPAPSCPTGWRACSRVVYLVFNEAYLSARPATPMRVDLADEAIRLGRQLAELMPDEPEVLGLLALMLAQHARAATHASTTPVNWC